VARTTEDRVLDGLVESDIKKAVEDLPENFRLPVLLADLEGFSYKEIAEILDIPIGTVMSRLHRGRKAMQKSLWEFAVDRGLVPEGAERP
jgi:RNA polymerase sigma-70 factor (ECF subfamily)